MFSGEYKALNMANYRGKILAVAQLIAELFTFTYFYF